MAENEPGDGYTSPFGNGQGATSKGASTRGNDFVTNPRGNVSNSMGRDFTKEKMVQPAGQSNVDESSVPGGGRQMLADATSERAFTATKPQIPFKNMKVPTPPKYGGGMAAPLGPESGGQQLPMPAVGELPEEG